MTLRIETIDGPVPLGEDFDDDSATSPVTVPTEMSPDVLRYIDECESRHRREMASAEARIVEMVASDLESIGRGRSVLVGSHDVAARVRSLRWMRAQRQRRAA